jgi:hypothetical protein
MRFFWIAAALGGSLLAACGGGGGGSTPPPSATVVITAGNQDAVARAAAGAVVSLAGAGGSVTASDGATTAAAVRSFAQRIAGGSAALRKRALAIPPEVVQCPAGGTATVAFTDNDNDGIPEVGDTMTLTYANCKETANDNVNGSIAVTLTYIELTQSGFIWFDGAMTINQLVATDGVRSATLAGGLALAYREDSATQTRLSLSVGTNGLTSTVAVTTPPQTETITYDSQFSYSETATYDGTTGALVSTSSLSGGGFTSSLIGGRVILEPQQAVVQFANEVYPRSGVLRVVGNGSALRLTALPATMARIELDANLDGNYEASKDVAWTVLLPT